MPGNKVTGCKLAYYAVQNVTAVFDNTLERIKDASYTHSLTEGDGNRYWISTDRSIAVYGYRHRETKKRVYTIWKDDAIPGDDCEMTFLDFAFAGGGFEDPVLVDHDYRRRV